MIKTELLFLHFIFLISISLFSQNPEWVQYTNGNNIQCQTIENEINWIGTSVGLVKLNIFTGEIEFYNSANSGLPQNSIIDIDIDSNGNKWVGIDWGGIACFDGENWSSYNSNNSELPNDNVQSIAIDEDGSIWVATYFGGISHFDGENWVTYNYQNSIIPMNNRVLTISISEDNTKWIGTENGLISYDDITWTLYDHYNSGIPGDYVSVITFDDDGYLWMQSAGLTQFDGLNWTNYNIHNSGLPARPDLSIRFFPHSLQRSILFPSNYYTIG